MFNLPIMRYARLGLVAMTLLVFGPLVGQLTASPMSSHMEMMDGSSHEHEHHSHHSHHEHNANMVHDWNEQCGYCTLLEHFPFLNIFVPTFEKIGYSTIQAPIEFTRSIFGSINLYVLALKRAPPPPVFVT
ncbi:DUF2946 domain-containing protein [Marinomonas sp. GJ51-6]|uniref:DUF2946 domain-containing protein n=1 Tax=Marinomonas sp. GJ51-6 TaxID=2992802 RepID=UPI002934E5C8|nr:DUF2946 domain-containing protein [Marinomonas sp. GJ51-6]WOD08371.1 DUF2946 domain-containing protein [Marinomonas sp. GJ51-6]